MTANIIARSPAIEARIARDDAGPTEPVLDGVRQPIKKGVESKHGAGGGGGGDGGEGWATVGNERESGRRGRPSARCFSIVMVEKCKKWA